MKRLSQKQKTEKALEIANLVESKHAGFFSRNSDNSMVINIRGAHGNDPNQWHNARAIEQMFCDAKIRTKGIEIDQYAGLLVIVVPGVYTGSGQ